MKAKVLAVKISNFIIEVLDINSITKTAVNVPF